MAGEGQSRESWEEQVGLEVADPRRPRLSAQECKPMALDPQSADLTGREWRRKGTVTFSAELW